MTSHLLVIATMLLLAATRPCSSLIIGHIISPIVSRMSSIARMSSSSSQPSKNNDTPTTTSLKRIFCYGDSLTAGTSPPLDQLFPYGPQLEQELNQCMPSTNSEEEEVMVRWRGLPGWTASAMVEYMDDSNVGLQSTLDGIRNPSLSLVIILAGTNDVGSHTSSMFGTNRDGVPPHRYSGDGDDNISSKDHFIDASLAVDPILRLHRACLNCENDEGTKDIHTLAVGIPGSAWQEMNPMAAKLREEMNDALQKFADSEDRVSYVDFPFNFERVGGGAGDGDGGDSKYWSGDGLHFSPEGYDALGRGLAPCVQQILANM